MRPAISKDVSYTVTSATQARKTLLGDHGVPRRETSFLTLDQLHDALARHMPEGAAETLLVVTDRDFKRLAARLSYYVRTFTLRETPANAPLMSRTAAKRLLSMAGAEPPEDAPSIELEDALAGLQGTRPVVIEDDQLEMYGREATQMLSSMPTGRSPSGTTAWVGALGAEADAS